jgi:hypothetical protein
MHIILTYGTRKWDFIFVLLAEDRKQVLIAMRFLISTEVN